MAAPMECMVQLNFGYENTKFTLELISSTAKELLEGKLSVESFIDSLIQYGMREQMNLPSDVDTSRILLIHSEVEDSLLNREQHNNVNTSKKENDISTNNIVWNDAMNKLLITTRFDMDDEFRKPIPKKKLWQKVANMFVEQGYKVSAEDCDSKWRNLMVTYKRNKDKAKRKTGESQITWAYYELFNEHLASRIDINPPPSHLISSSSFSDKTSIPSPTSTPSPTPPISAVPPISTTFTSSSSTSPASSPSLEALRKRVQREQKRKRENAPEWFAEWVAKREVENKEAAEREERRWEEIKAIELQRLELEKKHQQNKEKMMENLISVLQKLTEK